MDNWRIMPVEVIESFSNLTQLGVSVRTSVIEMKLLSTLTKAHLSTVEDLSRNINTQPFSIQGDTIAGNVNGDFL